MRTVDDLLASFPAGSVTMLPAGDVALLVAEVERLRTVADSATEFHIGPYYRVALYGSWWRIVFWDGDEWMPIAGLKYAERESAVTAATDMQARRSRGE